MTTRLMRKVISINNLSSEEHIYTSLSINMRIHAIFPLQLHNQSIDYANKNLPSTNEQNSPQKSKQFSLVFTQTLALRLI